jgi:UMF1 family MFS transporter
MPRSHVQERSAYDTALSRATARISSLGIAIGYSAGICLLIVALIPVTALHGSTFSLRLAIGLSGIWWAVFTLPAALWLPGGAQLDEEEDERVASGSWSAGREIAGAWKRLGGMLHWREIKRLRNTFKYLAAWFLLSDGEVLLYNLVNASIDVHQDSRRSHLRRSSSVKPR